MKRGFLRISVCPYQWTRGSSFEEERAVGAEVAVIPRGFAGDEVGIGASIEQEVNVPGIVKPP